MPASTPSDLRSEAKASHRVKSFNTKWARGFHSLPGQRCVHNTTFCSQCSCGVCPSKPIQPAYHNPSGAHNKRLEVKKWRGQQTTQARRAFNAQLDDVTYDPTAAGSENSSDDSDRDPSAAPMPDGTEYMYSYDAASGPTAAQTVLSTAITQAVQRFENTETEKLVTREYDVIDTLKEGYAADHEEEGDEDDYEMVEHAHLK